jgi:hypothetical protein
MTEPLPPETVESVLAELDTIVAEIMSAVRAASPMYGEVLAAPEGIGLRLGVEQAIRAFLEAIGRGERPGRETDELWRRLGEAEFQAGRELEELRLAFRAGTRAVWRTAAELAIQAGVTAPVAIALAEAIFIYADDLASDVVEGYLRMQSDAAGERERRRRRLAGALLDAGGYDPDAVARAAELAGWPVPRALAVVALPGDPITPAGASLEVDVLTGSDPDGAWLIVPDPDGPGRRVGVERALDGIPAALGPTVAPLEARRSLQWARLALELVSPDVTDARGLTRVSDHLPAIILLQDGDLARTFATSRLGPLSELPAGERERLTETLAAWLEYQRSTPEIAAMLHVHAQTVRYRVAKLREVLGDALLTPDGRFELGLALRIEAALRDRAPG